MYVGAEDMSAHREYFATKFEKSPVGRNVEYDTEILDETNPFDIKQIENLIEVGEERLQNILQYLAKEKVPGKDPIFNEMLKVGRLVIGDILTDLCNIYLMVGSVTELNVHRLRCLYVKNTGNI